MKILFDNNFPRPYRKFLPGHEIKTAYQMGWEALENGDLLRAAQQQFELILTTDSNIKYQQPLPDLQIALLVLRGLTNRVDELAELVPAVLQTLETIQPSEVVTLFTTRLLQTNPRK